MVFQIALKDAGNKSPLVEGNRKFYLGWIFLSAGGYLRRHAFDHSTFCQSKKHHSVNIEHQLKSQLARHV